MNYVLRQAAFSRVILPMCMIVAISQTVVQPARADSFTFEQFIAGTRVAGPPGQSDVHGTATIQNPLITTIQSQIGQSFAVGQLNWAWDSNVGPFNTNINQNTLDSQPGFDTSITAKITVMTVADVILRSQGSYTYTLPPEDLTVDLQVTYRDLGSLTNPSVVLSGFHDDSFFGGVAGTVPFDNQVILPAGRRFDITLTSRMLGGGGSNTIGTGAGFVNLSLNPTIPEPAMAGALVIGALTLARGRRYRFGQIR